MPERVEAILTTRFQKLFEGLDEETCRKTFEELIDEYTYAVYGLPILPELEKLKRQQGVTRVTIQPIAGCAIMVSHYGFEVISETQDPKGGKKLFLKEITKSQADKMKYDGH